MNSDTMFFDAYVSYGPWKQKHPGQSWRLESVLDDMKHCSISGALVTHRMCVNFDPMFSNLRLCDDIKGYDNLY